MKPLQTTPPLAGVCAGGGFLYVLDKCRVIKMSLPGLSPVGLFTPADYPLDRTTHPDRTHPFAGAHALAYLNGHLFVSCAGHGWDAGRNAGISIIDVRSEMTQQPVVSSQDEFCVRVYNGAFHLVQQIAIATRSRSPAAGNGVVGTGITVDGARMWVALSDLIESEANRGREMLAGKLALFVQAG